MVESIAILECSCKIPSSEIQPNCKIEVIVYMLHTNTSIEYFTGTLGTAILEVFMFFTYVTAYTMIIISCTHILTSSLGHVSLLLVPASLLVSSLIFCEAHVHLSLDLYYYQSQN